MTAQIANTINDVLKPQGVGVIIKATHHCMTTRGVHKPGTDLVTSRMLGCFRDNALTLITRHRGQRLPLRIRKEAAPNHEPSRIDAGYPVKHFSGPQGVAVSREFAWRRVRSALRRQPGSATPEDFTTVTS